MLRHIDDVAAVGAGRIWVRSQHGSVAVEAVAAAAADRLRRYFRPERIGLI